MYLHFQWKYEGGTVFRIPVITAIFFGKRETDHIYFFYLEMKVGPAI
jgi:hypothetical protein